MFLRSAPGYVITAPFKRTSVETAKKGLAFVQQKLELAKLEVLAPTLSGGKINVCSGDFVFVRGERYTAPWGREVLTVEGVSFILVPEGEVLAVEFGSLDRR